MPARSAGLLPFRRTPDLEVLLAHPGGPFWAKKDAGAWSIVKGEHPEDEPPLTAAQREFHEETGWIAAGPFLELGEIRQRSGKRVTAWAVEFACDPATLVSNRFTIEWPPRSGRQQSFPEIDRVRWCGLEEAHRLIHPDQAMLIERLQVLLTVSSASAAASMQRSGR